MLCLCFVTISIPLYRHVQTVALLFCNEFNCARFTRNSGEKDSGDHLIQSLMRAHALIPSQKAINSVPFNLGLSEEIGAVFVLVQAFLPHLVHQLIFTTRWKQKPTHWGKIFVRESEI